MAPVLSFAGVHYKVLGTGDDQGVVFAPREWRGNGSTADPLEKRAVLSPKAMAAELSNYPRGTVSHVYTTSDGGFSFQQLLEMLEPLALDGESPLSDTGSRATPSPASGPR